MASIHVGNLDPSVTGWDLYKTFQEAGPIVATKVCKDWKTRQSCGYGYVNFQNCEHAEWVMQYRRTWKLKGRRLNITWSWQDPPEPKPRDDEEEGEEEEDCAVPEEPSDKPVFATKYVKMYIKYQQDLYKMLAELNPTDAAACRGEHQETEAAEETPESPTEATEEGWEMTTQQRKAEKKRASKARKAVERYLTEVAAKTSNPSTKKGKAAPYAPTGTRKPAGKPPRAEKPAATCPVKKGKDAQKPLPEAKPAALTPSTQEEKAATKSSTKEEIVAAKPLTEEITTTAPEPSPKKGKAAKKQRAKARKATQQHLTEARDPASNPSPEEGKVGPTTSIAESKEPTETISPSSSISVPDVPAKKKKGFFSRIRRGLARAACAIRNVFQ